MKGILPPKTPGDQGRVSGGKATLESCAKLRGMSGKLLRLRNQERQGFGENPGRQELTIDLSEVSPRERKQKKNYIEFYSFSYQGFWEVKRPILNTARKD